MARLQKFPKNVGDLAKLIVAKGFEKLPKVQYITQYAHTGLDSTMILWTCFSVVSVKKAIESLLENDLDMSDLYLSEGKSETAGCDQSYKHGLIWVES